MKKRFWIILMASLLLSAAACGRQSAASAPAETTPFVSADPNPPVVTGRPAATPAANWVGQSGNAADEPAGEVVPVTATPKPTETPTPTVVPTATPAALRPGSYEGSDGSVLAVAADGTCTYETELSGTVNGKAMTGRITFHGTVSDGTFSFTKITYLGLDLTAAAAAAGYSDASYWESAAAILYAVA